ncbi:glutathione S-transferase [Alteromonadaceae bacterium M269]|nr:glutathione S-transferase [Alteromonadaceae bacterium M269]
MQLQISLFYGSLLGVFYIYLTLLVLNQRNKQKIGLGDGGDKKFNQLIRAHANFAEYVPLALVLILMAEVNHLSYWVIHAAALCLLFGRLLHAYGLRLHDGASWQRVVGTALTLGAILIAAVLNLTSFYI